VRELAKQGDNYKFRIYLHNNLYRPIVQLKNKEEKGVMNSTKHQEEEQYKFTVTRKGD